MADTTTTHPEANEFMTHLTGVPATKFQSPTELVKIPADCSLSDALKTIHDNHITAAPVYEDVVDTVVGSYPGAVVLHDLVYLGFVDVFDIATLVLQRGLARGKASGIVDKVRNFFKADSAHQADRAVNISGTNPFYGLPLTGNLCQAAKVMAHKGVRRVAIIDTDRGNKVQGVAAQSDVLAELHGSKLFGHLGEVPVGSLVELGPDVVATANQDTPLRQVLEILIQNNHAGMALVDDATGAITANFSVADVTNLAGLKEEEVQAALDKPAIEVLASGSDDGKPRVPVTVQPSDSLSTAVSLLATAKVHRVYVLNAARQPVGVLSISDILRLYCGTGPVVAHALPAPPSKRARTDAEEKEADATSAAAAADGVGAGAGAGVDGSDPTSIPDVAELRDFLSGIKVYEFCSGEGVKFDTLVDVPETMPVTGVLETLKTHKLSQVPVFTEVVSSVPGIVATGWPAPAYVPVREKKYLGWVGAAEIASLALVRGLRERPEGILAAIAAVFKSDAAHSAGAAMNHAGNPFWAMTVGQTLAQVARVLGRNAIHRVVIVDTEDKNRVVGLVSQSAIVRAIHASGKLGALAAVPVSSVMQEAAALVCGETESTRDLLNKLLDAKLTGAPVVNADGAVVDSISVNDLRGLASLDADAQARLVDAPVTDFLKEVRASSTPATLVIHPGDTFGTAVALFVTSEVHRLFVVDGDNKPVGVLTLTDVLRAVAKATAP